MTAAMDAPALLMAAPLLGATLGLGLWGKPDALKIWVLCAAAVSLGTLGWTSGTLPPRAAALPLLAALPVTAFVSLLGQPVHRSTCRAWLLTLLALGLGFGVLASEAAASHVCFLLLLAFIGSMLFHHQSRTGSRLWWEIGTLAVGVLASVVALTAGPALSPVAFALACATALPLAPFHKGYVAALTTLPGNLPAFLALVLPLAGFHSLLTVLPQLPLSLFPVIGILAMGGSVYSSLRALTQPRAASVTAYGSVAFLSIIWWYVTESPVAGPESAIFLGAVGLATSGLLLASFVLRARHGEIGLRGLSGLAQPMPRFAIVFSLLTLAAVGLPPFGVFAGFFGMLLAPGFTWSGGLFVIVLVWLTASWYLFDLAQGLLFGRQTSVRRHHEDLRDSELAALTIVLVLLVALGVLPSRLFDPGSANAPRTVVMGFSSWNR